MANTKTERKSGGGLLDGVWWLATVTFKMSTLVAVVALLVTVHNMRNEAVETAVLLEKAQLGLAEATQQKQAATAAYGDTQTQINKLQTDLADSRSELQKVQVELSKKQELQKELDRKEQVAKSAKQEALVLTQKLQELEADSRRKQAQGDQQIKSQLEVLQGEKDGLQQKLAEQTAQLAAANEKLQKISEEMESTGMKYVQAEKQREMLSAKEKAQDLKIEELRKTVKNLEQANKKN